MNDQMGSLQNKENGPDNCSNDIRRPNKNRGWIPLAVCGGIFVLSLGVFLTAIASQSAAEWISFYPSGAIRMVLAKVTSVLPFSVAEWTVIVVPVGALCFLVRRIYRKLRYQEKGLLLYWKRFLCTALVLSSVLLLTFFVCYHRMPLSHQLGLVQDGVSESDLAMGMMLLQIPLENLSQEVYYDASGASRMPYSYDELNGKLNECYRRLGESCPFLNTFDAATKPIALSSLMTYTHISGIYIPFTGEANVNTNYPDYIVAFSAAHEMAHQRGIAKEDEANFVAFLACLESDDPYLNYCACMNMLDFIGSAMYQAAPELYETLLNESGGSILGEMHAYYTFFEPYRESMPAQVADSVNDVYLKAQGQTEGVESYGMVVDLTIAYFKYFYPELFGLDAPAA